MLPAHGLLRIGLHQRQNSTGGLCVQQRLVFDDLVAPSTFVGTLDVRLPRFEVELANRKFQRLHTYACEDTLRQTDQLMDLGGIVAFKSVKRVNLGSPKGSTYGKLLDEAFFVPAAQRGVRHLKHCEYKMPDVTNIRANTTAALAFGFAEPTAGGDRSLRGIHCDVGADLLTHVKQVRHRLVPCRCTMCSVPL